MRKLDVERTQWAVGNGFFHSGFVASAADSINYVYDCGALHWKANQDALHRELAVYASRTDRAHLVFLSHFDFDHVSGLARLAKTTPVEKFIIPMITEQDRILGLARQIQNGSFTPDSSPESQFYLELIVSPENALRTIAQELNPEVVVQVVASPTDADDPLPDVGEQPVEPPTLIAPRELPAATTAPLKTQETGESTNLCSDKEIVWEWRYKIAVEAGNATSHFVKCLKKRCLISGVDDLRDKKVISDIVLNRRDDLIASYDEAIKSEGKSFNRNMTSLMLYSGPPKTSMFRAYRSRSAILERAEIGAWNPRPGWLGLGDADLRAARRVAHVNSLFREHKPFVGTFAPSHHGSKLDWCETLMDGFCSGNDFTPTTVFGASGAYGHPHDEVLMQINERGGTTVTVGLAEESRWTEALKVFVNATRVLSGGA